MFMLPLLLSKSLENMDILTRLLATMHPTALISIYRTKKEWMEWNGCCYCDEADEEVDDVASLAETSW